MAFTLVELLVVIGIIAVLIAILLPVLNSARRQSVSAKCLANLRTLGQALNNYSLDNKGCWPVVQHYDDLASPKYDMRWQMLLLRYVISPADADNFQITYGAGNGTQLAVSAGPGLAAYKDTALFCPASVEFKDNVAVAISAVQTGYGMQKWPLNSLTFPAPGTSDSAYLALTNPQGQFWARIRTTSGGNGNGRYYKATDWGRQGSERIIIADARSYDLDVRPAHSTADFSRQTPGFQGAQNTDDNQADRFRHGVIAGESRDGNNVMRLNGKVAYNALYCDGHAATLTTIEELFRGVRMRLELTSQY